MKRYRQQEFSPDVTLPMLKSENGDWVRYEDAAARIADLEVEIAERRLDYTEDCKRLDAAINDFEHQLAAAQEREATANTEIERLSAELSPLGLPAPFIVKEA